MTERDPDYMQSLARGLQVLEAFAVLGQKQSVAGLAAHTGLARGVVARCLHTLVRTGHVERQDRHFSVLPGVLRLADAFLSDRSLPALAQPLLEQLRDEIGESCSLGVLDRGDILYIARASRSSIMTIGLRVGSRLPAWCTSMGRVLLAELPPADRDALIPAALPQLTPDTVANRAALDEKLGEASRDGFALVDQELEAGLRSIAVPVRDADARVIAALNVGTNALERSIDDLRTRILPRLQATATALHREIGRFM
jgi:IclR family pca regulon transcriptional regulator